MNSCCASARLARSAASIASYSFCTLRMRLNSAFSFSAFSISRRSFSSFWATRASESETLMLAIRCAAASSFRRYWRSASSCARLARSSSSSDCLSFIRSCCARSLPREWERGER